MKPIPRVAAVLGFLLSFAAQAQSAPVVTTAQGQVQGTTVGAVSSWLGVPYAAPPVGNLRWRAPQPPQPYSGGVLDAVSFGASCPQTFDSKPQSESCLFLNIYAPAGAAAGSNLPVMVWIHGGSLISGQGSDYDGTTLVSEDNVVVVTINYRLGLLGFMADTAFAAEDAQGSSGNYGLQDQQAAVSWVKANIAGFGGNPDRVTIFGESAGGLSVETQLTSPGMPALAGAIAESGSYFRSMPSLATAEANGSLVAAALLCPTTGSTAASCLRNRSVNSLLLTQSVDGQTITPNVDGYTLPQQVLQAYAAGAFQHVPVMLGNNHDEYRYFVSYDDLIGFPTTTASYTQQAYATFGTAAPLVLAAYPVSAYEGDAYPCAVSGDSTACAPGYALAAVATDEAFACGAQLFDSLLSKYTTVYAYELNEPGTPNVLLPYDAYMPSVGDDHTAELPYIWTNIVNSATPFSANQQTLATTMRAYWTSLAATGVPSAAGSAPWPAYGKQLNMLSLVSPVPVALPGSSFSVDHKCGFWAGVHVYDAWYAGAFKVDAPLRK